MAQKDSVAEWVCPLCTLLNQVMDDRCAACDNPWPSYHKTRKSQSLKSSLAAATAQNVVRPISGVVFSSLPKDQGLSDDIPAWRQEPRLIVNKRRRNGRLNVLIDRERDVESERVETDTTEQNTDSTGTKRGVKQEIKMTDIVHNTSDAVDSMLKIKNEMERQEEEETAMEEPCFNLLRPGTAVFNAPVRDNIMEDLCAADETKSRAESEEVDEDNKVVSSSSRYPGFMPASKLHVEEPAIDDKLARAGLDLSDSEEEKELTLHLRQQKEDQWEIEWVCQRCTTLNERTALDCSSCSCKRYIATLCETDTETGSTLRWACHICTNLNSPDVTDCVMCRSTRKLKTRASDSYSDKTWACSLCTTFNDPGNTRCEVCDRLREEGPKNPAGEGREGRECPVCTNMNSPRSTRCEICETCLPTDETPQNHFVDLSFSPPARKASYTADQDDLENPYADLSQYNDCDAPNDDPDVIEEISDHEPSMSMVNTRPLKVRPELMEFKHFVCMEDLRGDYDCRINYKQMFAGQRSGKSYADRLAIRQAEAESRMRELDASLNKAGQTPTLTSQGGKAARGSNKRKTAAVRRRASAGGKKVPRTKRAKKAGASARPAGSRTTYPPAINHYDDSAASLGEDMSTMAWEGIGSAGYL